jgi:hypothetical protein
MVAELSNDFWRTHADLWRVNWEREQRGLRRISPFKSYKRAYPRLPSLQVNQEGAYGGWTLAHNIKRKPKRRAPR